jgi:hypothetical protein
MLMLIATILILVGTIVSAVQAGKIRGGWVPQKFAGRAGEFLANKRKEYAMIAWAGVVCGPAMFVMAAVDWGQPAAYERIAYGIILIACGAVIFAVRAKLPAVPGGTRP